MSVSFAAGWQDPTGAVVLEELTVTRILWQAAGPIGAAARAKRGAALCQVCSVAVPIHGLAARSLQGTVMTVAISGEKLPSGTFAIHLGLVPSNPMILDIADVSPPVIHPDEPGVDADERVCSPD